MYKDFVPPVSIEEFAAYLDGNLTEDGMNHINAFVSMNPDLEEIVSISSKIDENIFFYMQDEFAYEADMTALENNDFDIPNLDADIAPHIGKETTDDRKVACVADELTDIAEIAPFNDSAENREEAFGYDDFHTCQDDDSITISNHDNDGDVQDSSIFPFDEDFLSC